MYNIRICLYNDLNHSLFCYERLLCLLFQDSKRLGTWAGLRPYRESVRLEIDRETDSSKAKVSLHINQSISGLRPYRESIRLEIDRETDSSKAKVSLHLNQSIYRSINQSVCQSINQLVNQSVN
jgi:hypothetical protein